MEQVGSGDPAETRHVRRVRKESAVHVEEDGGPAENVCRFAVLRGGVHSAEDGADDLVGVHIIPGAHLLNRAREEAFPVEDIGVLSEETEDEPRHEMVHGVVETGAPGGVVLQQLDIQTVQPPGSLDVEGALADLFDGRDTGQGQEKTEMIGEIGVGADDDLAARQVFGLEVLPIGGEHEFCLGAGGRRAGLQCGQRGRCFACGAGLDVNMAAL